MNVPWNKPYPKIFSIVLAVNMKLSLKRLRIIGKIDIIFVFTFNVKHQVVFTSGVILTATTNDIIIGLHSIYSHHVKSQYESSGCYYCFLHIHSRYSLISLCSESINLKYAKLLDSFALRNSVKHACSALAYINRPIYLTLIWLHWLCIEQYNDTPVGTKIAGRTLSVICAVSRLLEMVT